MCPSRAPMEVTCEIHTPTLEDVATQQSGKLPVEIFANPTGVTNVYADGITSVSEWLEVCHRGTNSCQMHSS